MKDALDRALQDKLRHQDFDAVWLAVPERVDWQTIDAFTYRATPNASRFADIHLRTFLNSLRDPTTITMDALRQRYRVNAINDSGDPSYQWPVYQCLYAELQHDGAQYLLNNGTWYRIDANFRRRIENAFRRVPRATDALPSADPDEGERSYNRRVTRAEPATYALMDRRNIRFPDPRSPIEFCDLYARQCQLIHVKHYAGSSTLSHLFAQGVTSGILFAQDAGFRRAVDRLLPDTHKITDPSRPLEPRAYTVTYAIISGSQHPLNIPFFSKVTLSRAEKSLRSNGYNVNIMKISVA